MKIETSIWIDAPRDRVFDLFTDLRHADSHISAIIRLEVLTDGPIGEGTRFRETRKMFGKEHTEEMWFTGFQPDESYTVEAESCGSHYMTSFHFSDENGGTRVGVTWGTRPLSFMAKLMTPVFGRMMSKACIKMFDRDLQELKAAAEGTTPGVEIAPA